MSKNKLVSFYRYDGLSDRSYTMAIDMDTIESIRQVDSRSVSGVLRTKSGQEIQVSNVTSYETLLTWWREYDASRSEYE